MWHVMNLFKPKNASLSRCLAAVQNSLESILHRIWALKHVCKRFVMHSHKHRVARLANNHFMSCWSHLFHPRSQTNTISMIARIQWDSVSTSWFSMVEVVTGLPNSYSNHESKGTETCKRYTNLIVLWISRSTFIRERFKLGQSDLLLSRRQMTILAEAYGSSRADPSVILKEIVPPLRKKRVSAMEDINCFELVQAIHNMLW